MTDNEARSKIKYRLGIARQIAGNGVDGKAYEDLEIALQVMKELREYRELGNVEEFKALKEKNEPKKPLFSTVHGDSAYHCSSCKKFVGFYDTRIYEYCHNCGQKLDWE